ncbi:hypothetical protein EU523_01530, partial [Candidatus Heimdallarchaeota archaeon]
MRHKQPTEEQGMNNNPNDQQVQQQDRDLFDKVSIKQSWHQLVIVCIFHLVYFVFEGMNAFPSAGLQQDWLSAGIYCFISLLTLFYLWKEWETSKYIVPVPFVSLLIVTWLLDFEEVVTGLFILSSIIIYLLAILKPDPLITKLTFGFTGLGFFFLAFFMRFDRGFVKVNYEVNVVACLFVLLFIGSSILIFLQKENYSSLLVYNA